MHSPKINTYRHVCNTKMEKKKSKLTKKKQSAVNYQKNNCLINTYM